MSDTLQTSNHYFKTSAMQSNHEMKLHFGRIFGLMIFIEAESASRAYRSGVGPILSVESVVTSGVGRDLVVRSGNCSTGRTWVDREERGFSGDASAVQRGYSGN